MASSDLKLIRSWKVRISLLTAILAPAIAITGSFYSIKLDAKDRESRMNERVAALEINSQKQFADKEDLKEIRSDVKALRVEFSDLKDILIRRSTH